MFTKLSRALLGLAVTASSFVAIPVATSVVTASDGTLDNTVWGAADGGRVRVNYDFVEPGGNVRFTATTGVLMSDPNGALLLAGYVGSDSANNQKFASLVLDNTGNPVNTFSANGLTVYDLPNGGATQYAQGAAEKIYKVGSDYVLAGWVGSNESNGNPAMLRVSGSTMAKDSNGWIDSFNPGWRIVTDGRKLQGGGSGTGSMIPGASFAFTGSTGYVMSTDTTDSALTRVSRFGLGLGGSEEAVGIGSGSKTFNTAQVLGIDRAVSSFIPASTGGLGVQLLVVTKPTTAPSNSDSAGLVGLDISMSTPVRATNFAGGAAVTTTILGKHLSSITSLNNDSYILAGSDGTDTNIVKIAKSNITVGNVVTISGLSLSKGNLSVSITEQPVLVGLKNGQTRVMRLNATDLSGDSNFSDGSGIGDVIGSRAISSNCNASQFASSIVPGLQSSFWVMQSQWGALSDQYGASVVRFSSAGMSSTACPVIPPLQVVGTFSISGTTGTTASMSTPSPTGAIGNYTTYTYNVISGTPLCGLTLNPTNGKFEGTITQTGTGSVTVGVTNNAPTPQTGNYMVSFTCTGASGGGGGGGGGSAPPQACSLGAVSSNSSNVVLDTTFGSGGVWTASQAGYRVDFLSPIVGSDGKGYLLSNYQVDYSDPNISNGFVRLYRLDSSGAIDTTFGTNGYVVIDTITGASSSEYATSVVQLADGSVLVGLRTQTNSFVGQSATQELVLVRVTGAGALDASWGTAGKVSLASLTQVNSSSTPTSIFVRDLRTDQSGSVVVMTSTSSSSSLTYKMYKVSASGTVDSGFGGTGELSVSGSRFFVDSSNSIYVFGNTSTTPRDGFVSKFDSSGNVVSSFGVNGTLTVDKSTDNESLNAGAMLDGKLLFAHSSTDSANARTWSLVRVATSGTVDTSFGTNGYRSVSAPSSFNTTNLIPLAGGSILMQGATGGGSNAVAGLVLVNADGSVPSSMTSTPASFSAGTCSPGYLNIVVMGGSFIGLGTSPTVVSPGRPLGFKFTITGITAAEPTPSTPTPSTPTPSTPTPSTPTPSTPTPTPGAPTLVTTENQALLEREPGSQGMVVNGQTVEVESTRIDSSAARTPAAQRTPSQVAAIQAAGQALLQEFIASLPAGATTNVTVVNTATGAVMQNLVFDANGNSVDVPVEDILILDGPSIAMMLGSNNATISSDGKYIVGAGGIVGVVGAGFGSSTTGELVVMSTPTLVDTFTTSAAGEVAASAALPDSVGVGDHTLVAATNGVYAVIGIRVVPTSLPSTGANEGTSTLLVFGMFVAVMAAVVTRSRRLIYVR